MEGLGGWEGMMTTRRKMDSDLLSTNGLGPMIRRALVVALVLAPQPIWAQSSGVAGVNPAPGTIATGRIDVPAGVDAGTFIPVSVARGARPGPTLALIAGVHGSEFSPILALQTLPSRIAPRQLAGTVVMVHVANMPSFLGRTVYTGPVDGKNLNRMFPGRADGTLSERIAHAVTVEVIVPADVVIDMHSGDANEDLRPWTGYYAKLGTPEIVARSRDLALAFGLDYIVRFPFVPNPPTDLRYTGPTAIARGKPAFDVEVGRLGLVEQHNVDRIVDGVLSVMRHLQMIDGAPAAAVAPWFIDERSNLTADQDGIFYPAVRAGEFVRGGMPLGYITDFYGRRVQEIAASHTGVILGMIASPPVRKGDTLVTIGIAGVAP